MYHKIKWLNTGGPYTRADRTEVKTNVEFYVSLEEISVGLRIHIKPQFESESERHEFEHIIDNPNIPNIIKDLLISPLWQKKALPQSQRKLSNNTALNGILGVSPYILDLKNEITQVAQRDMTVLILGETGTGKELIADAIHKLGNRKKEPFIKTNCATFTDDLMKSEIFGHKKGAFTGATSNRSGCIKEAAGGILFLDEIGRMGEDCQGMMLRVLDQKEFYQVGSDKPEKADVRIVAATNDSSKLVYDFLQRLKERVIETKPLAERPEDIVVLVNHFIRKEKINPDPSAKWLLYNYDFPGNVRELKNLTKNVDDYNYIKNQVENESKNQKHIKEVIEIAEKYSEDISDLIKAHGYATLLSVPNISLEKACNILSYKNTTWDILKEFQKSIRDKFNLQ